jgi:hypothetical protein
MGDQQQASQTQRREDDRELLDEIAEVSLMVITGTLSRQAAEAFVRARVRGQREELG